MRLWMVVLLMTVLSPTLVFARMSSSNYSVPKDSLSVGDSSKASSTSYDLTDTMGDFTSGTSESASYTLVSSQPGGAGSSKTPSITIDSPSNVVFTALSVVNHSAVGDAQWKVKIKDAPAGYTMTVHASTSPALWSSSLSAGFADATTTPSAWSVSNGYVFGFSARGGDIVSGFGTGSNCETANGSDVPSTTLLWRGFAGTTTVTLATTTGTQTNVSTVCFASEQNGVFALPGSYEATIIVTAVLN